MPEVEPRSEPDRKGSVIASIVDSLEGDYWTISEIAEMTSVSVSTLRRWMRNKTVKAPSHQVRQGEMRIYLYDQTDLDEIKAMRDQRSGNNQGDTP